MNIRQQLRDQARQARQQLGDREQRSAQIEQRLFALQEFAAARWIAFYMHVRTEVQTEQTLQRAAAAGKQIAIPYCVAEHLRLFQWQATEDLAAATFGILEPRPELLQDDRRLVSPAQIDVVLVPGLVFDAHGDRLGYGRGYYDRLLVEFPQRTTRIGLAFDCQLVDEVPHEAHDQPVDWIVTESRTIQCDRR